MTAGHGAMPLWLKVLAVLRQESCLNAEVRGHPVHRSKLLSVNGQIFYKIVTNCS